MKNYELQITTEEVNDTSIRFILDGHVDSINANILERKLEDALRVGKTQITVNMSNVKYLISTGIRVLLSIYKKAAKSGCTFRIEKPSENVVNVLGMTALDEMLL